MHYVLVQREANYKSASHQFIKSTPATVQYDAIEVQQRNALPKHDAHIITLSASISINWPIAVVKAFWFKSIISTPQLPKHFQLVPTGMQWCKMFPPVDQWKSSIFSNWPITSELVLWKVGAEASNPSSQHLPKHFERVPTWTQKCKIILLSSHTEMLFDADLSSASIAGER